MQKRQFLILVGLLAGFVLVTLVVISIVANNKQSSPLTISNLDICSKNMNKGARDTMTQTVYSFIQAANDYNQKKTAANYTATIRKNSCTTTPYKTEDGSRVINNSSVILDIPDAKQSWKISYSWFIGGSAPAQTVVNGPTRSCVKSSELIYGDFNCDKIMSLATYGTDKYDPILPYMPYNGEGFNLAYDPDSKTVTATILVPSQYAGNDEFIQNNKDTIGSYWFTKRGLDPSKYIINYTSKPDTE